MTPLSPQFPAAGRAVRDRDAVCAGETPRVQDPHRVTALVQAPPGQSASQGRWLEVTVVIESMPFVT